MKKKKIISLSILFGIIFLIIYFFWDLLTFGMVGLISMNSEKNRIEITPQYIKTGWMLDNTTNFRLAIQEIDVHSLKIDTAKFEDFVENRTYTADSCMILFGQDNIGKIYFSKKSFWWTWDEVCNRNFDDIIEKKRTFEFKKNTNYRILHKYYTPQYSYKIYINVDSLGNIKSFMKPRDGKGL